MLFSISLIRLAYDECLPPLCRLPALVSSLTCTITPITIADVFCLASLKTGYPTQDITESLPPVLKGTMDSTGCLHIVHGSTRLIATCTALRPQEPYPHLPISINLGDPNHSFSFNQMHFLCNDSPAMQNMVESLPKSVCSHCAGSFFTRQCTTLL